MDVQIVRQLDTCCSLISGIIRRSEQRQIDRYLLLGDIWQKDHEFWEDRYKGCIIQELLSQIDRQIDSLDSQLDTCCLLISGSRTMSSEKIDTKVVSSSNSEQVLKYCLQLNSPEKVNKNQVKFNVLFIYTLARTQ